MRIFDVHTHPTFEATRTDRKSISDLVSYSKSLGVEGMVVLGDVLLYGRTPTAAEVQSINDKTAELMSWFPDYFHGFCFLNPLLGRRFVHDETDRCIGELGFKGIKLEICNNARDEAIIQQREYHTDPADTAWLGRQYPHVDIIMAHLTSVGRRGVMEIADVPNVWIDTSAFQPVSGLVEYAVQKLGVDRVLYGSDLVIRDLPTQIGRVTSAAISDAEKQKILFDNSIQLVFNR